MANESMFDWEDLTRTLHIESLDRYLFRGQTLSLGLKRVFGGQVLAQSLNAAYRSVDPGRVPHSMHGYFLRPGDVKMPIIYEVDPIRDGRSFSTRRVVARQMGEAIFITSVSFQKLEYGPSHQFDIPADIPAPQTLKNDLEQIDLLPPIMAQSLRSRLLLFPPDVIDTRTPGLVEGLKQEALPPKDGFWFRVKPEVGEDPIMHMTLLAYLSDKGLMRTGILPHLSELKDKSIMMASLDHAMWFENDINVNDWIYYYMDSPHSGRNRTLGRGTFFDEDGTLIASTAQEGLFRLYNPDRAEV